MVTEFGKFCRILRINNNEILGDMADKLNVSASYLSAVENGKRKIPVAWHKALVEMYGLDESDALKLDEAIHVSQDELRINLRNLANDDRDLVLKFARRLGDFDEDEKAGFKALFDK